MSRKVYYGVDRGRCGCLEDSLMKRLMSAIAATVLLVGAAFTETAIARPFPEVITLPGAT